MRQTEVFDRAVDSFKGENFSLNEIKDVLEKDQDWKKDINYIKSCLRDRTKKGNIVLIDNNIYKKVEKNNKKVEKNNNKSDLVCNGKLMINCQKFAEFENEAVTFLEKFGFNDTFLKKYDGNDSQILEKLLGNAFAAATAQGAFNSKVKTYPTSKEDLKANVKEYLKKRIVSYGDENYDTWHKETCRKLIDICRGVVDDAGNQVWTYGNSQKIVNLAVKYVTLITLYLKRHYPTHSFIRVGDSFANIIDELHVIIDTYIIGALSYWNLKFGSVIVMPMKNKREYKSWSTWNESDYDTFLPTLRCAKLCTCPFKWETVMWPIAKALKFNYKISYIKRFI